MSRIQVTTVEISTNACRRIFHQGEGSLSSRAGAYSRHRDRTKQDCARRHMHGKAVEFERDLYIVTAAFPRARPGKKLPSSRIRHIEIIHMFSFRVRLRAQPVN